MIPAIGASTTGTGTVSGPRVSGDMDRLSVARLVRQLQCCFAFLVFFACSSFETGPRQVMPAYVLGRDGS